MPYKANEARRYKIPRARYRVANWPEHDRALQQRGSLTVWVMPEALAAWHPPKTGRLGRSRTYSDIAIEIGHLLRLTFGRPLRQTEGRLRSMATLLGLDIGVPDLTTFSRRSPGLSLATSLVQAQRSGPVHVVIDATRLKVYGAGEWLTEKHGERGQRTWRKLHLAVDPRSEILASELTTTEEGDAALVGPLLEQITDPIASVIADGAYDGEPAYRAAAGHRPDPPVAVIIPPRANAVPSHTADTTPSQRDQHIRMIQDRGRLGWQKAVGYGRRSLGETAMSRYKTIIGRGLRARTLPAQKIETRVACSVLNRMTRLGMPVSAHRLTDGESRRPTVFSRLCTKAPCHSIIARRLCMLSPRCDPKPLLCVPSLAKGMLMSDCFRTKLDMIVHSTAPFNAEPQLDRLRSTFLTSEPNFYVRSHGDIPHLNEFEHRLRIDGRVQTPLDLSIAELRDRFPRRTVTAVMHCAGNRRADMQQVRPVSGDPWIAGAIGNAEWTGIALTDLLQAAGVEEISSLHAAFLACDEIEMPGESRFRFGASIPMVKAMSPEVLLAFEMNGEPLAPAHGFPLRAVVPGFAGVRSVKWLTGVTVQDEPSDNHMQQRDYKLLPPDVLAETVDWAKGGTIYAMPLTAAICEPAPYAELTPGSVTLRGYAVATAREIMRVDVSFDGGRNWRQAELEPKPDTPWSWTFWGAELDLPKGEHELVVRAWDSAGQTQPALPSEIWNFKGYLSAAWHRVPVRVG